MARTKGTPAAPKKEVYLRTFDHRGYTIAKLNDGTLRVLYPKSAYPNECYLTVKSLSEGKAHIDKILKQFDKTDIIEQEDAIPSTSQQRGRRTKGVKAITFDPEKYKHLCHGGYRMQPPKDCPHKCRFEGEPEFIFWVNNITCHGLCKQSEQCEHFKEFMKESRKRIKLQTTEKMEATCPYCKRAIEEIDKDDCGKYFCGTKFSRIDQSYERVCQPKKEKPKTRRTK